MRRLCLLVSAAVTLFAMGCSGGRAPTSPSRGAVESSANIQTMSPASALFGASAVDFALCLQAAGDAGCFAGAARMLARTVGAAVTVPGAPGNLSTAASGSSVMLTWGAPASGDPLTTYIIEAGSGPGLANLANFTTNNTATSFSASGIGAGTYYVRIRAQNAGGTGAASNESILVVGSAGCTAVPNAPTGFTIATNGSTVTLTWSAAGGCPASSYVLQAGSSAGLSDLANANVGATTTYVASGVGAGTYYVRVRAVNAYGQSAGSNEVVVIVGGSTPSTQTFTGSATFTVPAGVSTIAVQVWGAGGGSGGGCSSTTPPGGGAGGGGGGYAAGTIGVSPGQSVLVVVGRSFQDTISGRGTNGGASSIGSIIADGGGGGGTQGPAQGCPGASPGGTGGTARGGITNTSGNSGVAGTSTNGGNGGAAGGPGGGAGGTGGAAGLAGNNGVFPGGGGGGDGGGVQNGQGATGKIVVSW